MKPHACNHCNKKIKDDAPCRLQKGKLYHTTCLHDIASNKEQKNCERMKESILDYGIPKSFVDELCSGDIDDNSELLAMHLACTSTAPWILVLESICGYYSISSYSNRDLLVEAIRDGVLEEDDSVKYLLYKGEEQEVNITIDVGIQKHN